MSHRRRQQTLFDFAEERDGASSLAPTGAADTQAPVARPLAVLPGDESPGAESTAVEPTAAEFAVAESTAAEFPGGVPAGTVYLVDAFSLIFQVFHALPEMTSPSGQPVAAVHGFTRDLLDLLEKKKPDYLFVAFDVPGPTFRDELYPAYKAGRDEMPADLQLQIPQIRRMLEALGIPILELAGYEADDVLATVARRAEQAGLDCVLVTGDKDCRQLISERIKLYNIRKDQFFDAAALQADWGIRPDQVVDFQSLVGDSVDNIPGIQLIGPKIASELLGKHGTLEGVLDHAGEVSGDKRRANLMAGREIAMLFRRLVRLVDDVPLDFAWDAGRIHRVDIELVEQLCREFGFRRLGDRVRGLGRGGAVHVPSSLEAAEAGLGESGPRSRVSPRLETGLGETGLRETADYRTVATQQDLDQLVRDLSQQRRISVDTETTSTNPRWAEIVGYSFAWQPGSACYIPVRAPAGEPQLDPETVQDALRPLLEDPAIEKIGQNLKYDIIVLRSAGVHVRGTAFDTMVADYLLDPGERNHSLDDLAKRYLGHTTIKIKELIGTGKSQKRMDQVPVPLITAYAAEDADVPVRLVGILQSRLDEEGLGPLFRQLEMPLIDVLVEMEFNGIKVDVDKLRELGGRFKCRMDQLEAEIYELAGRSFNIDSRQQLAKVLFEDLQLPGGKKTKTGLSTDVEVLEGLAASHPLPAKIIEYRQYAKLRSTYAEALIELVHPQTGRVHTSFKQDVAATGRLSSTDPNLQNIPVRTEDGRLIRSAFVAGEPGWKLVTADYSQIELRVLAHFSGDQALQRAFAADEDIHALVASEVYGVPLQEVTREQRRGAKAVNFGVIYGQSPFGLAQALGIDKAEAAQFIDAYFARYPGVDDFIKRTLAECRKKGYVNTVLGRRRAVHGVRDLSSLGDSRQRNLPERIAINTVIQGSAADLIKKAMIQVHARMQREGFRARLLLQIHDELVFETPGEDVERLATLARQEMESVEQLSVPLKVDLKVGDNWADCEAWH